MKIEKFSCMATIQCAREHFSYCVAAHPHSFEGTLDTTNENTNSHVYRLSDEHLCLYFSDMMSCCSQCETADSHSGQQFRSRSYTCVHLLLFTDWNITYTPCKNLGMHRIPALLPQLGAMLNYVLSAHQHSHGPPTNGSNTMCPIGVLTSEMDSTGHRMWTEARNINTYILQ
jgi:hypothetical protein